MVCADINFSERSKRRWCYLPNVINTVPGTYNRRLTSRAFEFLRPPSSLKRVVVLTHLTAVLCMGAPSFKNHSHVLILLHCTKQDNLAGVAKELGVNIGAVGLDGDLEHLHKLLFEIRAQVLHLHCLCHYLPATDPTKSP